MKDSREFKTKGIYIWIFPNRKNYIGKCSNFAYRYVDYLRDVNKKIKRPVIDALRSFGIENCKYQIIEICEGMTNDEILFRESLWIKYYRSLTTQNGYNVCLKSIDCTGIKRTQDIIDKVVAARKGYVHSEETKKKMSKSHKGIIPNKTSRIKMSISQTGKKASIETRKKMSEFRKGKNYGKGYKHTEEAKRKMAESLKTRDHNHLAPFRGQNRKKIIQLDLNENFIKEWESILTAAKSFGKIHGGNINIALKNNSTAYGFKWKYSKGII